MLDAYEKNPARFNHKVPVLKKLKPVYINPPKIKCEEMVDTKNAREENYDKCMKKLCDAGTVKEPTVIFPNKLKYTLFATNGIYFSDTDKNEEEKLMQKLPSK